MLLCLCLVAHAAAVTAGAPGVLVLDASGSMWGQLQGEPKIDIARHAAHQALARWPADRPLALLAYGHRSKADCNDIETLVPLGPFDRARLDRAIDTLKPKGMTPVGASLRAAVALLPKETGGTVLLVSDGEETCRVDPCAIAREIKRANAQVLVHVVGFDVAQSRAQTQLACIAAATGGQYFDARDAAGLNRAISAAVLSTTRGIAPSAKAALKWAGKVPAARSIDVRWEGPGDVLDYLAFAEPGSPDECYVDSAFSEALVAGKAASVRTPAAAGTYELRYISPNRRPQVLARLAVDVAGAVASIEAPGSAAAGARLRVRASGPAGDHHWIGIAQRGAPIGSVASFVRPDPSGHTEVELTVPGTPGAYEIRYVLNERESIAASLPLDVVKGAASFGALPEAFGTGVEVSIAYEGPRGEGNWIGFVARGGDSHHYATFTYVPPDGPVRFFSPPDAGAYDLVLVVPVDGVDEIQLRVPVQVR